MCSRELFVSTFDTFKYNGEGTGFFLNSKGIPESSTLLDGVQWSPIIAPTSIVSKALNKFIKAKFIPEIIGPKVTKEVASMKNGEVVLLQNLRNDKGEQTCNKIFAVELVKLADIYVNEAFSVDHRADASIVLLPKLLTSYAGLQLEQEIKNLSHAFEKPKHPFLFILGGAKFSTKMPLIKKYLKHADHVL